MYRQKHFHCTINAQNKTKYNVNKSLKEEKFELNSGMQDAGIAEPPNQHYSCMHRLIEKQRENEYRNNGRLGVKYVLCTLTVMCLDNLAWPGLLPERVGPLTGEAHQQTVRDLVVNHKFLNKATVIIGNGKVLQSQFSWSDRNVWEDGCGLNFWTSLLILEWNYCQFVCNMNCL